MTNFTFFENFGDLTKKNIIKLQKNEIRVNLFIKTKFYNFTLNMDRFICIFLRTITLNTI